MADIFISYSSKDRAQAEQLVELLASAGLSVWIDKSGIDVATSWSGEISKAIEDCTALVLLLSPTSIESENVRKEVSLAAERKKKILPLDLEPVTLPHDFAYHLAGIQRTAMTNIDSIIRALGKLGLKATGAPQPPRIAHEEKDPRKSLIILPFEDLSPTQDNQWFADGLAGELIDMLGKIKSLRILDRKTSLDLRGVKLTTVQIGKEFNTRYFVEGSVRKFGEQIKISVSLLDIETGDHLWQESYKGVMQDIFDLQESVASQVVERLKLHLTKEEQSLLAERDTVSAEAYELLLKAVEYFHRQTKEGFTLAVQLLAEAILLDPSYAAAYDLKANALTALYRIYDQNSLLLEEAEALCQEALRLKPELTHVFLPLSKTYMLQGKLAEAEQTAKEYIKRAPEDHSSHFALGFFYANTGQFAKAIAPYEEVIRLKPEYRVMLFNLVLACYNAEEMQKCRQWALRALPIEEHHLRLHPDDEGSRLHYAHFLFFSDRIEDARREAGILKHAKDGNTLSNTAWLFASMGEASEALKTFRKAIEAGYRNVRSIKMFLSAEHEGIASLAGTPEYQEVKRMVEEIEVQIQNEKLKIGNAVE